ncbi:MAG: hypothetical protein J6D47_02120 [Peptostreptococcaceae bacterium]|nr:hypothetical protein [Peptostreptococcaceae bacterium]
MRFDNEEVKNDMNKYFYKSELEYMLLVCNKRKITLQEFIEKALITALHEELTKIESEDK